MPKKQLTGRGQKPFHGTAYTHKHIYTVYIYIYIYIYIYMYMYTLKLSVYLFINLLGMLLHNLLTGINLRGLLSKVPIRHQR